MEVRNVEGARHTVHVDIEHNKVDGHEDGRNDAILGNRISGKGYDPKTVPGRTFAIDVAGELAPKKH